MVPEAMDFFSENLIYSGRKVLMLDVFSPLKLVIDVWFCLSSAASIQGDPANLSGFILTQRTT
jgi:hypothetical protein